MPDADPSQHLYIRRDWPKLLLLLAICLGILAAAYLGVTMTPEGSADRRFQQTSYWMFPTFCLFTPFVASRVVFPIGPPIEIGPHGIWDKRAGPAPIPWDEISNVVRKGEYVTLTMRPKFAKTYRLSPTQKALKYFRKSAGPRHVLILDWCLKTEPQKLTEQVQAYWAAHAPERARKT